MNRNPCSLAILVFVVFSLVGCGPAQRNATLPTEERQSAQKNAGLPTEERGIEVGVPDPGTFIHYEKAPQPIVNPQPEYPAMAKRDGVEGKVVVLIYVDENGDVREWRIMKAEPEGRGFEEEVIKVIQKWKFTPAIQQNKPVGVWIAIPFAFELNE